MSSVVKISSLSVLALLSLTLNSCVTPPSGIDTVEMLEQEDIPIPKNFELRHSYSPKAAVEASFRSWVGEYVGVADIGKITAGFLGDMQTHRWNLRAIEPQGRDDKRLRFDKDDESAIIEITRRLDPEQGRFATFVRIKVGPRGPEELTVAEHLKLKEAGPRPTSFGRNATEDSTSRLENAIAPGELHAHEIDQDADPNRTLKTAPVEDVENDPAPVGKPKPASKPRASTQSDALKEIEQFEEISN